MKLAIVSDFHFGDEFGTLVTFNKTTKQAELNDEYYKKFIEATGTENDYLILAGDIFDFSIACYEDAYRCGRLFFERFKKDNIAKEIIYLAGNHDADHWHMLQHERHVIKRLNAGELPETYEHSVAGIIDDRKNTNTHGFWLNGVRTNADPNPKYGNMFLNRIIGMETDKEINFNFAYPNLYIATDNECVLVTHGHYFGGYWSFVSEGVLPFASKELDFTKLDIEKLVELNYPLSQLACTGIGQAGCLTPVIKKIQTEVKSHKLDIVPKYLNGLEKIVSGCFKTITDKAIDALWPLLRSRILEGITKMESDQFSEVFLKKEAVWNACNSFYNASLVEIGNINKQKIKNEFLNLQSPNRIIFGHTHQPISWDHPDPPTLGTVSIPHLRNISMHNTGGWIRKADDNKFCGAEIFTYETDKGFKSVRVN
jgi:UDP-2,3-diacylglucosamine pyrophosphatase LpxH